MTAQPTTPIPPYVAPQPPAGLPYPQSSGPGYPPVLPAEPKRSTGKVVGIVASVLVLLAGLGAGALFLFGQRTVEPESVKSEIVRITQTAVAVAPTDIRCPAEIKAEKGGTFVCTATVDGQPVIYDVRQDDDQGNLTINYDRLIKMTELESTVAGQVGKDIDVSVDVACEPAGRTVLVNSTPNTPIACTATNKDDSTDSAAITVKVAADGTPSYTFA
jgi:hypothetical protein